MLGMFEKAVVSVGWEHGLVYWDWAAVSQVLFSIFFTIFFDYITRISHGGLLIYSITSENQQVLTRIIAFSRDTSSRLGLMYLLTLLVA